MSASSRAPPSEMRTYFRPIARAMLLATEVLPTPGGPTNSRIGPRARSSSLPLTGAFGAGTVAVVVLVEDPLRLRQLEVLLAAHVPRQLDDVLQERPDDLALHGLAPNPA